MIVKYSKKVWWWGKRPWDAHNVHKGLLWVLAIVVFVLFSMVVS